MAARAVQDRDAVRETPSPTGPSLLAAQTPRNLTPAGAATGVSAPFVVREEPHAGQVLFDRYLVERLLGRGGMGSVWLVRHTDLDERRALKLIIPEHDFDPQILARFRQEAKTMAKLKSKNAVAVHNARISPSGAYIEMEYLDGRSLNDEIQRGVPTAPGVVAELLDQICEVLDEAHSLGIVHRDLKPSNLMLVAGRTPGKPLLKVLDFGIAKVLGDVLGEESVKTQGDGFIGTAQYSSPEQCHHAELDGRSDLYSVGVILYELLTGFRPFDGGALAQMQAHASKTPPPMSVRNPEAHVPPLVEAVVQRCLAKEPAERPPSARALADAFRRAVAGETASESYGSALTAIGYDGRPGTALGQGPFGPFGAPDAFPPSAGTLPGQLPATDRGLASSWPQGAPRSAGAWQPEWPPGSDPGGAGATAPPATSIAPQTATATDEPVPAPRRWPIVVGILALLAVAGGIAFVVIPRGRVATPIQTTDGGSPTTVTPTTVTPRTEPLKKRPPPEDPLALHPKDYLDRWREQGLESDPVVSSDVMPPTLVAKGIGSTRVYKWMSDGRYYLPDGFTVAAGTKSDPDDGWPRVIVGRDHAEYVRIPGGDFDMGSNELESAKPKHAVRLNGFYLKRTEVTNGELAAYFDARKIKVDDRPAEWVDLLETFKNVFADLHAGASDAPKNAAPLHWKVEADQHPAVKIDHALATAYAAWVGGQLPTEAQWEYGARSAGQPDLILPWGFDKEHEAAAAKALKPGPANLLPEDGSQFFKTIPTARVGMFLLDTTRQGVVDLAGNVREWCRDAWKSEAPSALSGPIVDPYTDKPDPDVDGLFAIRGGSFEYGKEEANVRIRKKEKGTDAKFDLGFRVVVETPYLPPLKASNPPPSGRGE